VRAQASTVVRSGDLRVTLPTNHSFLTAVTAYGSRLRASPGSRHGVHLERLSRSYVRPVTVSMPCANGVLPPCETRNMLPRNRLWMAKQDGPAHAASLDCGKIDGARCQFDRGRDDILFLTRPAAAARKSVHLYNLGSRFPKAYEFRPRKRHAVHY
jgi:hypothetical protein